MLHFGVVWSAVLKLNLYIEKGFENAFTIWPWLSKLRESRYENNGIERQNFHFGNPHSFFFQTGKLDNKGGK